eukprot:2476030-Rhodomonas_salina.2
MHAVPSRSLSSRAISLSLTWKASGEQGRCRQSLRSHTTLGPTLPSSRRQIPLSSRPALLFLRAKCEVSGTGTDRVVLCWEQVELEGRWPMAL